MMKNGHPKKDLSIRIHNTDTEGFGMGKREEKRTRQDMVIIEIVHSKGELKCSELEDEAKKYGISRPTLYRRLAELVDRGWLLRDRPTWRNSVYRLNYEAIPRDRSTLPLFRVEVLSYINQAMSTVESGLMKAEIDETNVFKELGIWVAGLGLFALLEEVKTGVPFIEVVHYYLKEGAETLLKRTVIQRETPSLEWRERQRRFREPLEKFEIYGTLLKRYEEALEKAYPIVEDFKGVLNKIREGKSEFKPVGVKSVNELKG